MVSSMAVLSVFVKHILGGVNYAFVNVWYDSRAWWLQEGDASLAVKDLPQFKKSFFVGFIGFFSGWIVMLPLVILDILRSRTSPKHAQAVAQYSWRNAALLVMPSVFDWLAVSVSLLGTKYISAVLVVVVKATRIVFSSLLSRCFLGTRLKPYQLLAIGVIVPGVFLVGLAKVLVDHYSDKKKDIASPSAGMMMLGMTLVLLSEFLRASKGVYEERLLKNRALCAKFIATVEGAMCCLLSLLTLIVVHLAVPGTELAHVAPKPPKGVTSLPDGSYENFWNTWEWLRMSGRVQYWTAHMFITQGFISYGGLLVTKHLSAVHCALWAEIRILVVWLTEVLIYQATKHQDGQELHRFTYVNLIAFALIIFAGLLFNRTVRVPGMQRWYEGTTTTASKTLPGTPDDTLASSKQ